jgi:hypothetical protein
MVAMATVQRWRPEHIGQVGFADFLTDRHHNTSPTHHGAETEGDSHHHFHPERDKAGGVVQLAFQGVQVVL